MGVSGLVGVCGAFVGGGGGGGCCGCCGGGGFGCETKGNALFDSVALPTGLELDIGWACNWSGTCTADGPATPVVMLPLGVAGAALGVADGLISAGSGGVGVGVRERGVVAGRFGVNGSVSGWAD